MIKVENLTKYYGNFPAIKEINFEVQKGEVLGFLGPNGAGKTTTMRILSGAMPASYGKASIAEYDVFESPIEVKKRVGYLPEYPPLYREMTVYGYLKYVAKIKNIPRKKIKDSIYSIMEKCSINHVAKRLIGNLSKGYQQRVGLAQALIHNPEVLILDEPTIGLDPKQIIEIRAMIKGLADEHTVILSTHILPEVVMTCNRVIIINEGELRAMDTYEGLSAGLRKSEVIKVGIKRENEEIIKLIKGLDGVLKVDKDSEKENSYNIEVKLGADMREEIARIIVENNGGLLEMQTVSLSLEDVFLQLTTEEGGSA